MDEDQTPTIPAPNERGPIDPHLADIHARLDKMDATNNAIIAALARLTPSSVTAAAMTTAAAESAAGSFRAPAPKVAPIVVAEKSAEDKLIDNIVDRLQARLGLQAASGGPPAVEPGGPCNLCDGTGVNAGGVVGCNRCQGSGIMPGRRLS